MKQDQTWLAYVQQIRESHEKEMKELQAKIEFWKQEDQKKLIAISALKKKLRDNGFLNV